MSDWTPVILLGVQLIMAVALWFIKRHLNEIHVTFNSKMDKLFETVAAKAHAEGVLAEKERAERILREAEKTGTAG